MSVNSPEQVNELDLELRMCLPEQHELNQVTMKQELAMEV